MNRWLDKFKNSPERPIARTDKADIGSQDKASGKVKDHAQEPQENGSLAEAKKVRAALYRHGLVKIRSETLGEVVCWARDDKEAAKAPAGTVVYTLDELRELTRGNPTREGLRQVHEAKKIFGGTVHAGTFSWDELWQKKARRENRPPEEEDLYLQLFQNTLGELSKFLEGQDGITLWLEKYRPGLAARISQSEERLNEFWGQDLQSFKAEVERYRALNEQAIKQFLAGRRCEK